MPAANIHSINLLDELKSALSRFSSETLDAMDATERTTWQVLEWLQERLNHWHGELERQQTVLSSAESALASCQATQSYNAQTGQTYIPDCSRYQEAVLNARVKLRQIEAELENTRRWNALVERQKAEYEAAAQGLRSQIQTQAPKASTFLERARRTLLSYTNLQPPTNNRGLPMDPTSPEPSSRMSSGFPDEPLKPSAPPEQREGAQGGPERKG